MIESIEYAIELPGVGFYDDWIGHITASPRGIEKIDDALKALDTTKKKYRNLGVPGAANQLRVVKRSRILTYTEWEPVT